MPSSGASGAGKVSTSFRGASARFLSDPSLWDRSGSRNDTLQSRLTPAVRRRTPPHDPKATRRAAGPRAGPPPAQPRTREELARELQEALAARPQPAAGGAATGGTPPRSVGSAAGRPSAEGSWEAASAAALSAKQPPSQHEGVSVDRSRGGGAGGGLLAEGSSCGGSRWWAADAPSGAAAGSAKRWAGLGVDLQVGAAQWGKGAAGGLNTPPDWVCHALPPCRLSCYHAVPLLKLKPRARAPRNRSARPRWCGATPPSWRQPWR
jgi:hypothetical protein